MRRKWLSSGFPACDEGATQSGRNAHSPEFMEIVYPDASCLFGLILMLLRDRDKCALAGMSDVRLEGKMSGRAICS